MMLVDKLRERTNEGIKNNESIIKMNADFLIDEITSACEAKSDMGESHYSFVFTELAGLDTRTNLSVFQFIVVYFTDGGLTVTTETISNFDSPESKSKFVMNLQW